MFDQALTLRKIMADIDKENRQKVTFSENKSSDSPQIITITGGKGGIGKTLISANLAISLQRDGFKTLLIDGDYGLANLDVILNLQIKYTLDDVFAGERLLKDIIVKGPENIKIIPSASGMTKISDLSRIQKLLLFDQLDQFDEKFDVIIIDTPAGISKNVQLWTSCANEIIVIANPEPTSLADVYATMKVLHHNIGVDHYKLIVNMVKNESEGLRVFEKLSVLGEEYLGIRIEYLGSLALDDCVRQSVRERFPYVLGHPLSLAAKHMRQIARTLSYKYVKKSSDTQFFWQKMLLCEREIFG